LVPVLRRKEWKKILLNLVYLFFPLSFVRFFKNQKKPEKRREEKKVKGNRSLSNLKKIISIKNVTIYLESYLQIHNQRKVSNNLPNNWHDSLHLHPREEEARWSGQKGWKKSKNSSSSERSLYQREEHPLERHQDKAQRIQGAPMMFDWWRSKRDGK